MRYYMTVNQAREHNSRITCALFVALGVTTPLAAERIIEGYTFRVNTRFGQMTGSFESAVKYFDSNRYMHGWVHFRFDNPDACNAADAFPRKDLLNRFSGKWNFMLGDNPVEIDEMISAIRALKPSNLEFI